MMDFVQIYGLSPQKFDPDRKETEAYVRSRDIFDGEVLKSLQREPDLIERIILTRIVESFGLEIHFEYISGVGRESRATAYAGSGSTRSVFYLDMVLDKALIYLFLTVIAAIYHPEEADQCREIFRFLIRDVLTNRKSTDGDWKDIIKDLHLDDRAIVQAFGLYWSAWTFMAGHEICHLAEQEGLSVREDEFRADRFGFRALIRFIQEQKAGVLPAELDCFYEEYYLAPCMLMEIFREMDRFREKMPAYGGDDCHPSPEERMQALFDLFDTDVPDDMDTENGNAFLNAFLDAVELIGRET